MKKQLRQIDYACMVNERIFWTNLQGERFEGVIKSWDKDNKEVATVEMDDGVIKKIEC
jgi:hypothetical protein